MGLFKNSSFAKARFISGLSRSFKLSDTSTRGTLGWKKTGASIIDKTDSTLSTSPSSASSFLINSMISLEKISPYGSNTTIRKSELPNSFSILL